MISGARQGVLSGLRRLAAEAMARDLCVFFIPGVEIARAYGLDFVAAGLRLAASPRHASVLVLIGPVPTELCEAAVVIYAQMVRPRAILVLGAKKLSPLPPADVTVELSQQGLLDGVRQLREVFAEGAFHPDVTDFDAPMLHVRIEYTCSMHPEIVQDEPGSCPKCGMTLIPREVQAESGATHSNHSKVKPDPVKPITHSHKHGGSPDMNHSNATEYTCPMHPEVVQNEPGSCPKCGMFLQPRESGAGQDGHQEEHAAVVEYTCPMHPEVVQNEPGSCPKCGMHLEPKA